MTLVQIAKPAGGVAAVVLLGFAGFLVNSPRVNADSGNTDSAVQIGFEIAPQQPAFSILMVRTRP